MYQRTSDHLPFPAGVSWQSSNVIYAARRYPIDIICAMMLDVSSVNQLMPALCLAYACKHKNPDPRVRRYFAYMSKTKLASLGYDVEKVADGSTDIYPDDVNRYASAS